MSNILAGNYEFLIYQNGCLYKMAWCSINTIARMLSHIPLERAGHHHSNMVRLVCDLSYESNCYNTVDILCEYCLILVHIVLNIAVIQIPHTVLECWWPALAHAIQPNTLACVLMLWPPSLYMHIMVNKEFIIFGQNGFHSNQTHVTCQLQYWLNQYT